MTEKESKKIICTAFSNGRRHDFRMFKESKVHILQDIKVLADSGMQKIHGNVELPHKKTKKRQLTKKQKRENQELMSKRAVVENVIGLLKRFKIIADRYRNRQKRFGLRFNLIEGIYNLELVK